MGFLDRAGRRVERKRWSWVAAHVASDEEPLGTTPTWVFIGDQAAGGHLFVTDRNVFVAATQPPFGSERRPFVYGLDLEAIDRLAVTDNGLLLMLAPDSRGNPGSTLLDPFPSPISQNVIALLFRAWEQATGREVEGDTSAWDGEEPWAATRSERSWMLRST